MHRNLVAVVCVAALLGSTAALAEPTREDWIYLQRVHVISQLNGELWRSVEGSELPDPEIARFAKRSTHMNRSQLERWGAPNRELVGFHRELVGLLQRMEDFYGAVGAEDFERAKQIGARIQREMHDFGETMEAMAARFE